MTHDQAMAALEAAGTEQNRKIYARHGADPEKVLGVSHAALAKIAKEAGTDQKLADSLWATGNHDARQLAVLVADPDKLTTRGLEKWVKQVGNYMECDALAALTTRTPHAASRMRAWIDSRSEFVCAAGWTVAASLAMAKAGTSARAKKEASPKAVADVSEAEFFTMLDRIEWSIETAPNRVKHAMNSALIAIGLMGGDAERRAVSAAKRIGKIEVNHGQTGCKTPDAASYIEKVKAGLVSPDEPVESKASKPAPKSASKSVAKKPPVASRKKAPAKKPAARKAVAAGGSRSSA